MTFSRFSRRNVLRCAGGALLLPMLDACDIVAPARGRFRGGGLGKTAKRFVGFGKWNGTLPSEFFPATTGAGFEVGRLHQPLAEHRDHLVYLKGVDNAVALTSPERNGHAEGVASMLTGFASYEEPPGSNTWHARGESVDQAIARHITDTVTSTRFESLQLGVSSGGGGYGAVSYAGPDQPMDAATDPVGVFSLLFDDFNQDPQELAKRKARKLSVLDGAISEFDALSTKISGADRQRIEAHLESLRSVEMRVDSIVDCDPTSYVPSSGERNVVWRAMLDMTVLAFACDLTRVVTFTWDHAGGGGTPFPWLGIDEDYHEISHQIVGDEPGGASWERFVQIQQWFAEELAYFASALQATVTPDGTLFDETIIFEGTELAFDHDQPDMPYWMLAGPGTPLRRGNYLALPAKQPHNKLLTTLCHAFGMTNEGFGDPAYPGDLDAELLEV